MNTGTPVIDASPVIMARIAGFIDHLRLNDFKIGPKETRDVAQFLARSPLRPIGQSCTQLKILLSSHQEEWERFDDLFAAFWTPTGRERRAVQSKSPKSGTSVNIVHGMWQNHFSSDKPANGDPDPAQDVPGEGEQIEGSKEKLVASAQSWKWETDYRKFLDPEEIAQAEQLAYRLARAMRNRLSRRYRSAARGSRLDFRKTMRANQCHGGDPITLIRKSRPDRPVKIVVFLDVSGSMKMYSQFFLQFVKGLVCKWIDTDAYLFHTRLVRVTDAVRDKNSVKAMTKLSLMTDGYGGGTKLAKSLGQFNSAYAKFALTSRTVVIIISDGYDTGSPEDIAHELARLKRRAPRLVWLNPMLGWRDYEPITAAMAAAMPHIDHFAPANSLASLAAIEPELARL
jgi:uncharacterized protein with von Willebrand factor type A (vWA) domain